MTLCFSHLREHKFRHNFAFTANRICSCAFETGNTEHFFLRCLNYALFHTDLMNELSSINRETVSLRPTGLLEVVLCGDKMLNDKLNY